MTASRWLTRIVRFHPAEADRIADRIAQEINAVSNEIGSYDTTSSRLDFSWEGLRKTLFFDRCNPRKRELMERVQRMKEHEGALRRIIVERVESYPNPAYTGE